MGEGRSLFLHIPSAKTKMLLKEAVNRSAMATSSTRQPAVDRLENSRASVCCVFVSYSRQTSCNARSCISHKGCHVFKTSSCSSPSGRHPAGAPIRRDACLIAWLRVTLNQAGQRRRSSLTASLAYISLHFPRHGFRYDERSS